MGPRWVSSWPCPQKAAWPRPRFGVPCELTTHPPTVPFFSGIYDENGALTENGKRLLSTVLDTCTPGIRAQEVPEKERLALLSGEWKVNA
jgi:hypothetical protein